ncbi:hypothetical protein QTP88_021956 [Uroleucon formosanum]
MRTMNVFTGYSLAILNSIDDIRISTHNHNTVEINALLFEILEGIVANITNDSYDYQDDDNHSIRVVESLLFVMVSNTSSSDEALSTELLDHVDCATIPEDTTLGDTVQKGDENIVNAQEPFCLASDTSASGDAPSPKLEHNETTLISEDGPFAGTVKDAVSGEIEPD